MMKIDKQHIMQNMKWVENDGKIQVNYCHPNLEFGISCSFLLKPQASNDTGNVLWCCEYPEYDPGWSRKEFLNRVFKEYHVEFDVILQMGLSKMVLYVNQVVDEKVPEFYRKSNESKAYHKGLAYMAKTWSHRHEETATDG